MRCWTGNRWRGHRRSNDHACASLMPAVQAVLPEHGDSCEALRTLIVGGDAVEESIGAEMREMAGGDQCCTGRRRRRVMRRTGV